MKQIKTLTEGYEKLISCYDDTLTLVELALETEDESVYDEVSGGYARLIRDMEAMKLATLLSGDYDSKNAILTFHAGAGGTEAQDWAQMLYRMYTRWAERHGYQYRILDYLARRGSRYQKRLDPH
jgi:peptide chain release factor 2